MAKQKLHERVREHVRAAGLTQIELSRRTGWHTHRVWRLLSGRQSFTVEDLEQLSRVLRKPVAEIYGARAA